ncbi:TPR domain protein [Aspergillus heteromorphus CBS 117.55]|uniref:TPR domain protein n=1 Tax=Aspergillus heteromorphus CBS 117.55 TaxID=1448321 RepID=A0A317X0N0_9EURO|nr:TPR domain protein [Aspergillus heteromorphus CBS 117.55]PWY92204.1 TPR domain protein [Aspergillus heteromorphus CBS 117.55]
MDIHEPWLVNKARVLEAVARDDQIIQSRKCQRPQPRFRPSCAPPPYLPCVTPLNGLRKAMLRDLFLEIHHRGVYVLVRTIEVIGKETAVTMLVEDEQKTAFHLSIYNQEPGALHETLRQGTVMIVKEPYLRSKATGEYAVCVDHLSDVIYLYRGDQRVPSLWRLEVSQQSDTAPRWEQVGNGLSKMGKYYNAMECYVNGLRVSTTESEAWSFKLNLALALIQTQQYDAAIKHLDSVPESFQLEKALFCVYQALYGLERYEECYEALKTIRIRGPSTVQVENEFTKVTSRLAEQRYGRYSFKDLQKEAESHDPPLLDRATYIGPVAVRAAGSRGRGLFTTNAVNAGDLLFCEKAFVHSSANTRDVQRRNGVLLLANSERNNVCMGEQAYLISLLAQKLYRNPSLAPIITGLYHGSYMTVDVTEIDGTPVVDTFLAERIITLNAFGCPLSSRKKYLRAIGIESDPQTGPFPFCGLWPTASYINNNCNPNAYRSFIGDMMIVRATKNLPPNAEITFNYFPTSDDNYDECLHRFDSWKFHCQCAICTDVQAAGKDAVSKRKALTDVINRLFRSPERLDANRVKNIIVSMEATYPRPASEVPRISVWNPQMALGRWYRDRKRPLEALDWMLRALESFGYVFDGDMARSGRSLVVQQWGVMDQALIGAWLFLADVYRDIGSEAAAQAIVYAKLSYQMCIGESETFDGRFGRSAAAEAAAA